MTEVKRPRGRPPVPKSPNHTRPGAKFSFTYRDMTTEDAASAWSQLRIVDIAFAPFGGRQRIAVVTGYSRRSVDAWFTARIMPVSAAVAFSLCHELAPMGFDKYKALPHVTAWPTGLDLVKFLPRGNAGLLDPKFREWVMVAAPDEYYHTYGGELTDGARATAELTYRPPHHVDLITAWQAQQRIKELLQSGRLDEHTVDDYYAAKFYDREITEAEAMASLQPKRPVGRPKRGTTASGTGHAPPQTGVQTDDDDFESMQERMELAAEAKRREAWESMPDDYVAPVLPPAIPVRSPTMVNSLGEMAKAWGVPLRDDQNE